MDNLNIPEKYNEYLQRERKIFPCHTNRASQIGHPCLYFLYLQRTQWEKQVPPELSLLRVFKEGAYQEKIVKKMLMDAGITLIREEEFLHSEDLQLSGHIDGVIQEENGKSYIVEIKSLSPFNFQKLNSTVDFLQNENHYIREYYDQMQCYLFLTEMEEGIFLLKNKSTGELKQINIHKDDHYINKILIPKIKKINEAVKEKKPPAKLQGDYCLQCSFFLECQPEIYNAPANVEGEQLEELDTILDNIDKLKEEMQPMEDELRELEEKKKKILETITEEKVMTAHYFLEKKKINVKPHDGYSYTRWNVKKLKEVENDKYFQQALL